MKADPSAQRRLLDLAAVDAELSRAEHRRRTLPEQAAVEEAERTLRAAQDAVVVAQTALSDLDRDVAKLDREVEQVRTRETRDQQLLANGSVSAKQASDLQHELASLERRRAVLEEEQLEVMERQEAAGVNLKHETEAHDAARTALADAVERRDGVLGDIDVVEVRRGEERTALLQELPEDLVALYEKLRARGGAGAGELVGNRCGACRLEMDRSELREIQGAAPDDVVRCENCGAIVVRTGK
ncbi:zinc ribbon domain-containing protein [Actinomycetospora chiangmaiensis]|uniref:zinc ribbon domain-containing protein n=1 Tax=Actinomycetospora chiangmaiensis TaxID=402650 RepID=UPI000372DF08|nr:C4-type zinc ribbon domain-containing protein [Actinomycetospora chiangmaiensis]